MAILNLPKEVFSGLKVISKVSDEDFPALLTILTVSDPSLNPLDLSEKVSKKLNSISASEAKELVIVLCSFFEAKDNFKRSPAEFSNDLTETLVSKYPLEYDENSAKSINQKLMALLSLDGTLATTVKARSVISDHGNVFLSVKVISDIRPIFSPNAEFVAAFGLVHNLKISYCQYGKHKEFFTAMDDDDLKALKHALERAEKKSQALKSIIKKTEILYLN